jgi:riboflavin kinase/FMN adenylyltransferase
MLYIGNRPTVDSEGDLSVEAHLIGFDGDLYGKDIEISVISRVREQRKFNSMEDLKDQIVKDCEAAKDIFCKK